MNHCASLHKRKLFCLTILFITFSIFTADIFDLREELQILSCPYTGLDDDITTGMTDRFVLDSSAASTFNPVHRKSSVAVSSTHLLPCGFRAPPFLS
jgi:hypothetical protein